MLVATDVIIIFRIFFYVMSLKIHVFKKKITLVHTDVLKLSLEIQDFYLFDFIFISLFFHRKPWFLMTLT